jgi:hypothetical protein
MTITDRTWRGHLGVAFDTTERVWDAKSYRIIIKAISSCFRSTEIKSTTSDDVREMT